MFNIEHTQPKYNFFDKFYIIDYSGLGTPKVSELTLVGIKYREEKIEYLLKNIDKEFWCTESEISTEFFKTAKDAILDFNAKIEKRKLNVPD